MIADQMAETLAQISGTANTQVVHKYYLDNHVLYSFLSPRLKLDLFFFTDYSLLCVKEEDGNTMATSVPPENVDDFLGQIIASVFKDNHDS